MHTEMPQTMERRCIAAAASVLQCLCCCTWQCVCIAHQHLGLCYGGVDASVQQAAVHSLAKGGPILCLCLMTLCESTVRGACMLCTRTCHRPWQAAALLLQHLCCSVCAAARGSACALRITMLACVMVLWLRQCSRQLCIRFKRGQTLCL